MTTLLTQCGHRCKNCAEDTVLAAAEKRAKCCDGKSEKSKTSSKTALKATVLNATIRLEGAEICRPTQADGTGKVESRSAGASRFTVKSNFSKVKSGQLLSKGHYLYGRKSDKKMSDSTRNDVSHVDVPSPHRATCPCNLSVTPRRLTEEDMTFEKAHQKEEAVTSQRLFVPAQSVVPPHALHNDDLRYLFRYGVHLPVLLDQSAGNKTHDLSRLALHEDYPSPPPNPSPVSVNVEDHYAVRRESLAQLPEVKACIYDDEKGGPTSRGTLGSTICYTEEGLCEECGQSYIGDEQLALADGMSVLNKRSGTCCGSMYRSPVTTLPPRERSVGRGTATREGTTDRPASGGSVSRASALSRLPSYNWTRAGETDRIPQVALDRYFKNAYGTSSAGSSAQKLNTAHSSRAICFQNPNDNTQLLIAPATGNASRCRLCKNQIDVDAGNSGSSEASLLSSDAAKARSLVKRISELEGLKQTTPVGSSRSDPLQPPPQMYRRDYQNELIATDDILYNHVRHSLNWFNLPKDSQTPIAILGRSLVDKKVTTTNATKTCKPHRASKTTANKYLLKEKGRKSSDSYLDYVQNLRGTSKTGEVESLVEDLAGPKGRRANTSKILTSAASRQFPEDPHAMESVFKCNHPMDRKSEDHGEQQITADLQDETLVDAEAPAHSALLRVRACSMHKSRRPTPANTVNPPHDTVDLEMIGHMIEPFQRSSNGRDILMVDLRSDQHNI